MDFTHSRAEMAHMLGISEPRLQQLTGLGIVTRSGGADEPLQTALAYLAYVKRDDEAKAARTRHVNAKALQVEQRVRREQRRLLVLDEMRQICGLIFDQATHVVQAESSRFYSEYSQSHSEHESRVMTGRLYDPLLRIPDVWGAGVMQLCEDIDHDHLPDGARLDYVLAELIAEIAAANKADL